MLSHCTSAARPSSAWSCPAPRARRHALLRIAGERLGVSRAGGTEPAVPPLGRLVHVSPRAMRCSAAAARRHSVVVHAQEGGTPPPSQQQQDDERRLEALEAAAKARKGVKAEQAEAMRPSRPAKVLEPFFNCIGDLHVQPRTCLASLAWCLSSRLLHACAGILLLCQWHGRVEGRPAVPRG
jgi:hypothetical protein